MSISSRTFNYEPEFGTPLPRVRDEFSPHNLRNTYRNNNQISIEGFYCKYEWVRYLNGARSWHGTERNHKYFFDGEEISWKEFATIFDKVWNRLPSVMGEEGFPAVYKFDKNLNFLEFKKL